MNIEAMSMCYINTRSLKNKTIYLNDYIAINKYNLIAFSERWLNNTDDNAPYINVLLPEGYDLKHVDRENSHSEVGELPQGSILGPLLFLIYINDLSSVTPIFHMLMYADDTTLYCNLNGVNSEVNINNELS